MPDFASPSFGGFAFVGSLAAVAQFSVRPMTLRHRVFPALLFLGATLLLHFLFRISITQMFYISSLRTAALVLWQ
jgi:hypothetical protein